MTPPGVGTIVGFVEARTQVIKRGRVSAVKPPAIDGTVLVTIAVDGGGSVEVPLGSLRRLG